MMDLSDEDKLFLALFGWALDNKRADLRTAYDFAEAAAEQAARRGLALGKLLGGLDAYAGERWREFEVTRDGQKGSASA